MAAKQKILIVDDDVNIAELISLYLTKECFDTKMVHDGEYAVKSGQKQMFRLSCYLPKVKSLTRFSDWSWGQMTIS